MCASPNTRGRGEPNSCVRYWSKMASVVRFTFLQLKFANIFRSSRTWLAWFSKLARNRPTLAPSTTANRLFRPCSPTSLTTRRVGRWIRRKVEYRVTMCSMRFFFGLEINTIHSALQIGIPPGLRVQRQWVLPDCRRVLQNAFEHVTVFLWHKIRRTFHLMYSDEIWINFPEHKHSCRI